jgi:hypothetical protein
MTVLSRPALPVTCLAALLCACTASSSVDAWRGAREFTLPQSVMGALPCVSDGLTRAFQVTPRRSSHTSESLYDLNRRGGLGAPEELEVIPATGGATGERVLLGFWTLRPDTTRVRVAVLGASGERRGALEGVAAGVLEQCGAFQP